MPFLLTLTAGGGDDNTPDSVVLAFFVSVNVVDSSVIITVAFVFPSTSG